MMHYVLSVDLYLLSFFLNATQERNREHGKILKNGNGYRKISEKAQNQSVPLFQAKQGQGDGS